MCFVSFYYINCGHFTLYNASFPSRWEYDSPVKPPKSFLQTRYLDEYCECDRIVNAVSKPSFYDSKKTLLCRCFCYLCKKGDRPDSLAAGWQCKLPRRKYRVGEGDDSDEGGITKGDDEGFAYFFTSKGKITAYVGMDDEQVGDLLSTCLKILNSARDADSTLQRSDNPYAEEQALNALVAIKDHLEDKEYWQREAGIWKFLPPGEYGFSFFDEDLLIFSDDEVDEDEAEEDSDGTLQGDDSATTGEVENGDTNTTTTTTKKGKGKGKGKKRDRSSGTGSTLAHRRKSPKTTSSSSPDIWAFEPDDEDEDDDDDDTQSNARAWNTWNTYNTYNTYNTRSSKVTSAFNRVNNWWSHPHSMIEVDEEYEDGVQAMDDGEDDEDYDYKYDKDNDDGESEGDADDYWPGYR